MPTHRPFAWLRSWSLSTAIALLGTTAISAQAEPTFESIVLGRDTSSTGSSLYGTFLDVAHRIHLSPGTVHGAAMGNELHTESRSMVSGDTCAAPVAATSEPLTYALMLGGLGVVGWVVRRRRPS